MDDYESELLRGIRQLNYKLVDAEEEEEEQPQPPPTLLVEDDSSDTISDLPPMGIPMKVRRRSSVSKYSLSFEVDIPESYVSSSAKTRGDRGYRPKLSDFEPIKVLGQGSYGKVLLVREKATGNLFAQKQLNKASLIINETNEINKLNYQRTLNERTILEKVNHPNIVKLYYAFQDHSKVYIILEYLDGGELFHHLAEQTYLSEKDASFYIAQIVLALRYLHLNLKVIYRDLKPENCMLNSDGNLVLTDFGLLKESHDHDSKHSMIGTAQYMAPEVIKGEEYDFSVDWWSLGCVAYDILTGSPPFTGHTNDKIMDKIVHSKKHLKFPFYLSNDAKDFLRKLLQADPAKRFDIDHDFEKFKQHRFFRYLDWNDLINGTDASILPPILPVITDPILAENFDKEFTDLPMTPESKLYLSGRSPGGVLHVKGFSYTNETYLAKAMENI